MHDLISVSRLLNAGVKVVLDDINSHIVLPNGERIHARCENGLFMLNYLVLLCDVKQEYSCPFTSWMNGLVEQRNRQLKETSRKLLIHAGLGPEFWGHSIMGYIEYTALTSEPMLQECYEVHVETAWHNHLAMLTCQKTASTAFGHNSF